KFTSAGSVRLHANAGDAGGRLKLRFDVTHTGIGFGEFQKQRLFQPFSPAPPTASQVGGTGPCPPLPHRLLERVGGEVGRRSAGGQGSLLWFTIPAERAEAAPSKETQATGTLTGHVLVVEDNAVNRLLIGAYLEEFGLTYDVVDNGALALRQLAAKDY